MGKPGKIQAKAEYAAARTVLDGLKMLPREVAVSIGRNLGAAAYQASSKLRRTGERNLEIAFPEKSADERTHLLKGCFDSLGRLLGEFSQFPKYTPDDLRRIVDYDEESVAHMRRAEATGRGIIFLTLHLGAWELISFAHSAIEHPLHFMVRRLDNPLVEDMVEARRTRFGNVPVDKRTSIRTAIKVLKDGGTLGILADLNSQPKEGVFVPFFGVPACTTAGVAWLALRTNALVIPVCAPYDKERDCFAFQGQPVIEPVRTGDEGQNVLENTRLYTAALEKFVRRFPEQWLWVHKRWRTRPAGEPDLYT